MIGPDDPVPEDHIRVNCKLYAASMSMVVMVVVMVVVVVDVAIGITRFPDTKKC